MKVFYLQLLVLVPLILGSGCSSEEESKDLIDEKNGSAHSSGNPLPLEGPDGDMDRDGIPNAQMMVLEGVGHEIPEQMTEEITSRMIEHFSSI